MRCDGLPKSSQWRITRTYGAAVLDPPSIQRIGRLIASANARGVTQHMQVCRPDVQRCLWTYVIVEYLSQDDGRVRDPAPCEEVRNKGLFLRSCSLIFPVCRLTKGELTRNFLQSSSCSLFQANWTLFNNSWCCSPPGARPLGDA